ncbi:TonB-dependent receptor plug domain-containing protein [Roseateles sp.]|uniref:TonB-dependent receptor plug domain-containing protein n=1 Tax=Roseateles sp. TaxID=1971397 RepID=UPI003943A7F4
MKNTHTPAPALPARRLNHLGLAALLALSTGAALAQASSLPQVVVTATRHALPLQDAPAALTVVSQEELAERGTENLLQALRTEPSVSAFGRPTGGRKALSLRGMDPRHVLVLVDGARISASDGLVGSSDYQLDWTGAMDIARVEVVRGPMSVLYGAEALGGVINVITQPLSGELEARAFAEARFGQDGGDGHRLQAALRGSFTPQLRFGISLADGRRQSTPQSADATLTAVEGRRPREAAVHLAWLPVEGHTVKLDTRHADELRWFDARERSGKKRLYQSETPLVRDHHLLAWEADWGGGRESLLRVYENRLDTRNTRSNGVAPLRPNVLGDQVLEGQFAQPLPGGQQLTAGFEHRTEWLDNAALPGGHAQARHTGLYVQDEARIGRSLLLTGGLRHDNTQGYASQWSPRVYAVWTLAPEWVLKGGAGSGFKAPNLKQVNPAYREDEGPSTYLGQAGLRPELNRSLEAGLAWDRANTGASLMLFQNRIHDLITPVLLSGTPASGTYQFRNVDRAVLRGAEASAGWRAGAWQWRVSGTWLSAHDGQGLPLEKRATRTWALRGDWRDGPWAAGGTLDVQSGLHLAATTAGQPPQTVPLLSQLNLHLKRQLADGFTLRVGLDNATNLRLASKSPLFSYEEQPRTLRVSLEARQ